MADELVDDLAAALETHYDLRAPVSCRFVRGGFNEHFRAEAGGREYHVRVYLDGKYYIDSADDFRTELAFATAVAAAGGPVAAPIHRRDGDLLTVADLGGRSRCLAVFAVAPGDVTQAPDAALAGALGDALARIHEAADSFSSAPAPVRRYHLDERYLIHQPIEQLRRAAGDVPAVTGLTRLAGELEAVLRTLPREAPDYGLIHADLHLGNVHFDAAGRPTVFDFDHCAFGWRAYDFATLRMALDDGCWEHAIAAYEARRALPVGIDRIADLVKMRVLWDVGDMLAMEATWGTTKVSDQVGAQLPRLAERLGAEY